MQRKSLVGICCFYIVILSVTGNASAASAVDVVSRLQRTPENQRQPLLEEEAKKRAMITPQTAEA